MDIIKQFEIVIPEITQDFSVIEVLYLFGSCASGKNSPKSDVDVALFVDDSVYKNSPLVDLEVAVALEKKLGRDVDVVVMNRVSPIMQHEVLRTGMRLFERSPQRRCLFELRSFKEYVDAKYYQRERRGGEPLRGGDG
jgi:predicted nucleotidyltransferase